MNKLGPSSMHKPTRVIVSQIFERIYLVELNELTATQSNKSWSQPILGNHQQI